VTAPRAQTADSRYAWSIVAALGVTATVSYGVLGYAFSIVIVPMQESLGWSRAELTGAYSLSILVSGVAALAVGRLLDRRSPRVPMTLGSALAAALVFAWSRVDSLPELYLVFAGIGLAMALVLYEAVFVVVTKWFVVRRGAALTTVTLIAAFASFVFSPLTERLVTAYGWRDAIAILALVLAAVTVPLHALVLRPAPPHDHAESKAVATAYRSTAFWLLVSAFVLSAFATAAVTVHLVPLLIGRGREPAFAAFAAGLLGLAQLAGRLLFALGTRAPAAAFTLAAVSLAFLALEQSRWAVVAFALAYGTSNGMTTLVRATVVGDLYGVASYGTISGVVSAFVLGARAAGPFGAALLALLPGGYTTLLVALAAGNAAAAAIAASALRTTRQRPISA
jgi:hypothetical protein